ncbi:hypothetical protein BH23ACT5_BH23ACT5_01500 [soil metagenome]
MNVDDLAQARPSGQPVRSRLDSAQKWILVGWIVAAAALSVWFLDLNSHAGEWADLVNVIALMFFAASLVTVGITYVFVRFVLVGKVARSVGSLMGPPGLFGLVALSLWLI